MITRRGMFVLAAATLAAGAALAQAQSFSFGVMADTQWTGSPDDGLNPNSVAVDAINQLNQQFINKGVKFVVAVGDVTDSGSNVALDTRAAFAQPLYNAGVAFYPLRGNHESSKTAANEFQRIFPQTQNGVNNSTPSDVFTVSNPDSSTQPLPTPGGSNFSVGSNFDSPSTNLKGLTYSFDYNNARFVLLDQFTPTDGASNSIDAQQSWISSSLAGKPANGHAFVFGHKGIITENHTDTLFGSSPAADAAGQDAFISSLQNNGVRYYMGGHDHLHDRAIVTTTDKTTAKVQDLILASDSSKFYGPKTVPNDTTGRETLISQELGTVGYYIYTVDGPRVTADYYSTSQIAPLPPSGGESVVAHMSNLSFTKHETFGYSLNGKEFVVPQGASYTAVQDSIAPGSAFGETYKGTSAAILDGVNGNTSKGAYDNRPFSKDINTGWAPAKNGSASDVLTLWGLSAVSDNATDTYALSISFDASGISSELLKSGYFALASQDASGNWVNAVDQDNGGVKNFVLGAWNSGYGLGTYGIDLGTGTAWAVINHASNFAVAAVPEPATLSLLALAGLAGLRRRRGVA